MGLLFFPEMVDMSYAVETETKHYLPGGHFNNSVDGINRPQRWSEGEGHFAIEIFGTPEGVVGKPTLGDAEKAKRPVAAIVQVPDHGRRRHPQAFPPGTVPPVEETTFRTAADMEPFLREPGSPGWKPITALPMLGQQ